MTQTTRHVLQSAQSKAAGRNLRTARRQHMQRSAQPALLPLHQMQATVHRLYRKTVQQTAWQNAKLATRRTTNSAPAAHLQSRMFFSVHAQGSQGAAIKLRDSVRKNAGSKMFSYVRPDDTCTGSCICDSQLPVPAKDRRQCMHHNLLLGRDMPVFERAQAQQPAKKRGNRCWARFARCCEGGVNTHVGS